MPKHGPFMLRAPHLSQASELYYQEPHSAYDTAHYPTTCEYQTACESFKHKRNVIITLLAPLPPLQQVPTTPLLFILLTRPAWLSSSDPPTSKNLPCRPPLALHHLPTPLTLSRPTNLPPLRRGTHRTHPEIGWDLLPSTPTRGSLSTALWVRLMVFMPLSMTAGEYGGLR